MGRILHLITAKAVHWEGTTWANTYLIKYVGCQDARHQSRFHSLFISEEVELSINNA